MKNKKCLNCNKKFKTKTNNKKHCSKKCKDYFSRKFKQKYFNITEKNCETCDKKIKVDNNSKKKRFCSSGCRRKAYRKTDRAKLGTYIYNRSDKRKVCSKKYAKSEKGKLLRKLREKKYRKNPEWIKKRNKERKVWDNDYRRTLKGKAARKRYSQKWYYERNGKEKQSKYRKEYIKRPGVKESINARFHKRRAQKLKAIPKWCNLEKIKEIYKNCPKGHHVDHIIPLQGENVSGLHVENNLQYLTARENVIKGNKLLYDR